MFRGREEGQALVETAISMSLLVVMMLGAVEFGRLAFAALEVNNAAKAAAQYGSQSHATALDRAGMLQAAQNEFVTPSAVQLLSPTATSGYSCSCADSGNSASCTNNSITSPECPGSYVEVTLTIHTQTSFDPLVHIPGFAGPFTLNGVARQKVLQ